MVSANRWLRGIKTNRFPWYLTLVSANHASSNPGLVVIFNNQIEMEDHVVIDVEQMVIIVVIEVE